MSEGDQKIDVRGLVKHTNLGFEKNPSGQSAVLKIDDKDQVVIAREHKKNHLFSDSLDEARKRQKAVKIYKEAFGRSLPPQDLVILQGEREGSPVPVIGRLTTEYQDVTPITEMKLEQILNNSLLCKYISEINLGYLKILLKTGKMPDIGHASKEFNTYTNSKTHRLLNSLTNSNILVGKDKNDNYVCFPDPDWVDDIKGSKKGKIKRIIKYASLFAIRSAFFKAAELISITRANNTKTSLSL